MKKLSATELFALQHGDKVTRFNGVDHRTLRYVGRMPQSKNYLIFSAGEHLEHLYISSKDNSFSGEFYGGEYNSKFVGNILIKKYEDRIKSVRSVYLREGK